MNKVSLQALLLALLAAVVSTSLAATNPPKVPKVTNSPTVPPSESFNELYLLKDGTAYQCPYNVTKGGRIGKCADGSSPQKAQAIPLRTPGQRRNWMSLCGERCIQRNELGLSAGRRCVGYSRVSATTCLLHQCSEESTKMGPTSHFHKTRSSNFVPTFVQMDPSCFIAIPTNSPTTARPTFAPTIPHCPVAGIYARDFSTLEGAAVGMEKFVEVLPNEKLCEYVRPTSMNAQNVKVVSNYTCSPEACVRWCAYDSYCTFSMWSPVEKLCYKANNLEMTDNDKEYLPYWAAQWRVWMRRTIPAIRYFSGRCNDLPPVNCKPDPECEWNKGKVGYNDPTQGGGVGGFCGRVKCFAATTKSSG